MSNIKRPFFSIGVFLRLLESLPLYVHDVAFCRNVTGKYEISQTAFTNLKSFSREFITRQTKEEAMKPFCSEICTVLLQNEFFCHHDPEIMFHFLAGELNSIVYADNSLIFQKEILQKIESPFIGRKTKAEMMVDFYESLNEICILSIESENNTKNQDQIPELVAWDDRIRKINEAYRNYLNAPYEQRREGSKLWSSLWTLAAPVQANNPGKTLIQSENVLEHKRPRKYFVKLCFVILLIYSTRLRKTLSMLGHSSLTISPKLFLIGWRHFHSLRNIELNYLITN